MTATKLFLFLHHFRAGCGIAKSRATPPLSPNAGVVDADVFPPPSWVGGMIVVFDRDPSWDVPVTGACRCLGGILGGRDSYCSGRFGVVVEEWKGVPFSVVAVLSCIS